jgi:hypothetical protein
MNSTLRFDPGGHIGCLYTEAIDLRALGRLQVVQAPQLHCVLWLLSQRYGVT